MPKKVSDRLKKVLSHPLHVQLGLTEVNQCDDQARFSICVNEHCLNPSGALHGGVLYLLSDVNAYLALLPLLADQEEAVTHDLHVSVMRSVALGDVIDFTASVAKKGRQLCFLDVQVHCSGRLVAEARVTKSLVKIG